MPDEGWRRYFEKLALDDGFLERLRKIGLYLVDLEDGWTQNSLAIEKLGYKAGMLRAEELEELIHPEDLATHRALWERVIQGWEDEFFTEFRIRDVAGNWRWIQTHGTVLRRSASGGIALYAGFDQDITARKEAETLLRGSLAEEERRFALAETLRAAGMAASTMLETDATVDLVLQQAQLYIPFQLAAVHAFGGEELSLIGKKSAGAEDGDLPEHGPSSPIWEVVRDKSPRIQDDIGPNIRYPSREGAAIYHSWVGIPLVLHRELIGVLEFWHSKPGAFRSEQVWPAMAFGDTLAVALSNARKYQSLMEEARTDPLTGLHSRRFLMEKGAELLAELEKEGQSVALILLDIDHFKLFNDKYGHLVGDEVLRGVAELSKKVLRQEDLMCRFGGEEYVALLPNVSAAVAKNVADRIRSSLERAEFPGIDAPVTASFGVAISSPGRNTQLQELIRQGDEAMYRAKAAGRNRVVLAASL